MKIKIGRITVLFIWNKRNSPKKDVITRLIDSAYSSSMLSTYDNKRIVWEIIHNPSFSEIELFTFADDLINEVIDRLYPEYDGEKVIYTDFGWFIRGEKNEYIVYDKQKYEDFLKRKETL